VAFNALLLFSDIAPNFVQFQAASADANHHPVMQFGAAATDAGTKAHDGIAVNAGDALTGLSDSDKVEDEPEGEEESGEFEDSNDPPPPPPLAQGKVKVMEGERIVFTEETNQQNYLKLIASGDVDETMLDALEDYVKRQKKRLGLPAKKEAAN